jgi:hypothetical protein
LFSNSTHFRLFLLRRSDTSVTTSAKRRNSAEETSAIEDLLYASNR